MIPSIPLIWLSIICYNQFKIFIKPLVILIFFFSFITLPQIYEEPYGIIIHSIQNSYQIFILTFLCLSIIFTTYVGKNFTLLLLGFSLGIIQAIQTTDWFNMYVAFELLIILLFIVGIKIQWKERHEYLKLQIISSCFILFGIVRIYAISNNLIINQLSDIFWSIGLAMKIGIWPFERLQKIYLSLGNKYIFIFVTCILSKSLLYCISFSSEKLIQLLLFGNLLKSNRYILEANSIEALQLSNLVTSTSITGLLILKKAYLTASIYAFHFLIEQFLFVFNYKKTFCFFSSGLPFSPLFFLKIFILKSLGPGISAALIISNKFLFCWKLSVFLFLSRPAKFEKMRICYH